MRWFVYCGTTYYPYAETVEADTAREAARLVAGDDWPVSVFPAEARALLITDDEVVA